MKKILCYLCIISLMIGFIPTNIAKAEKESFYLAHDAINSSVNSSSKRTITLYPKDCDDDSYLHSDFVFKWYVNGELTSIDSGQSFTINNFTEDTYVSCEVSSEEDGSTQTFNQNFYYTDEDLIYSDDTYTQVYFGDHTSLSVNVEPAVKENTPTYQWYEIEYDEDSDSESLKKLEGEVGKTLALSYVKEHKEYKCIIAIAGEVYSEEFTVSTKDLFDVSAEPDYIIQADANNEAELNYENYEIEYDEDYFNREWLDIACSWYIKQNDEWVELEDEPGTIKNVTQELEYKVVVFDVTTDFAKEIEYTILPYTGFSLYRVDNNLDYVLYNSSATLEVAAKSTKKDAKITYQWYTKKYDDDIEEYIATELKGETKPFLITDKIKEHTTYCCVAKDGLGNELEEWISLEPTVYLGSNKTQPKSTLKKNTSMELSVDPFTSYNGDVTYKYCWGERIDTDDGYIFSRFSNATKATYTVPTNLEENRYYYYECHIEAYVDGEYVEDMYATFTFDVNDYDLSYEKTDGVVEQGETLSVTLHTDLPVTPVWSKWGGDTCEGTQSDNTYSFTPTEPGLYELAFLDKDDLYAMSFRFYVIDKDMILTVDSYETNCYDHHNVFKVVPEKTGQYYLNAAVGEDSSEATISFGELYPSEDMELNNDRPLIMYLQEGKTYYFQSSCVDDFTFYFREAVNDCSHDNTVVKNKVTATCKDAGYTGDTYCNDCKTYIQKGTAIAKTTEHSFVTKRVEPTTTAAGSITKTCSVCGKIETTVLEKLKDSATTQANGTTQVTGTTQASGTTQSTVTDTKVPGKVKGIKTSVKKRRIKISWRKSANVTGYKLQYSTSSKFKKKVKTVTIKTGTSYKTPKLKKGTYYVRVRSYLKQKDVTLTTGWVKTKKIKVK